jgi:hypothetical protein
VKSPHYCRIRLIDALVLGWLALVLLGRPANAQAVRFDTTVDTVSSSCAAGKQCPLLVLPGSTLNVCGGAVTTLTSCLASPATTYTSYTAGTPCPTTAQLTPATGGACLSTADGQGGAGFWALPGQYNYFLQVPATAGGGTYGPYPINVGASAGCPLGATCDANYATLALACTGAGTGTLYLTRTWSGLTTQSIACNIQALAHGIIKPASGQTVTLTGSFDGDLTQHFDLSAGGTVSLASAKIFTLYPQWWGALCGGNDDTVAVQNTYNSIGPGQNVTHTCQSTISSTVYLPQSAQGVVINGIGLSAVTTTNLVSTTGSTLIAKAGTSPFVMFHDYAARATFNNFLVNGGGNASASSGYVGTECFVVAGGYLSIFNNSGGQFCSSDGIDIDSLQTPLNTSLTTVSPSSYATITATSVIQAGFTMGTGNCQVLMLEPGTGRQEEVEYLYSNQTTLSHLAITPAYTHTAPFSFQCNGNNNAMRFYSPVGTGNQGWGLNVHAQSDGNGIELYAPQMTYNVGGGELLAGSGFIQTGGHFEGNVGPGIQMGDLTGRQVFGSTFGPPDDMENQTAATNGFYDVCGTYNTVTYRSPNEFIPTTAATGGCSALAGSNNDVGWGTTQQPFIGTGQFSVKNNTSGIVSLEPWHINDTIRTGLEFTSTTAISSATVNSGAAGGYTNGDIVTVTQSGALRGKLTLTVSGGSVTALTPVYSSGGIGYSVATNLATTGGTGTGLTVNITSIGSSVLTVLTGYDYYTGNMVVRSPQQAPAGNENLQFGSGSGTYEAQIGINTTNSHAVIQGTNGTSGNVPLDLNPDGGNISTGNGVVSLNGQVNGATLNYAHESSGSANNAIVVTFPQPLADGLRFYVELIHTLAASSTNTLTCICGGVTSGPYEIRSHYSTGSGLTNAYGPYSFVLDVEYVGGNVFWLDMSQ